MSEKFSHLNDSGEAKMVDVGAKEIQKRTGLRPVLYPWKKNNSFVEGISSS